MTETATLGRRAAGGKSMLVVAAFFGVACVGSEPRERPSDVSQERELASPDAITSAGRDTVAPLPYQIFETTVASESPKRMFVRMVVTGAVTQDALSKTIRVALDSIGGSDSTLAAARAVLYLVRPVGPMEGELVPRVWGEWAPPGGWDAVSAGGRRSRLYRTFIYHANPGWGSPTQKSDESERK